MKVGFGLVLIAVLTLAMVTGCSSDERSVAPSATAPHATEATGLSLDATPTTGARPTTEAARGSTADPSRPATAEVDLLAVATPDPSVPTYRRDEFGEDWIYDPTSGCNTRERVLAEESLVPVTTDDRCHPLTGRWRSLYDRVVTEDPSDLQIDHFVPLSNAWRSGAWTWTGDQRLAFANDLTDPWTLLAVTSRLNESKGDSGPEEWMPPDQTSWCDYATAWVQVKHRWNLTVTPAEKAALVRTLSGCSPVQ